METRSVENESGKTSLASVFLLVGLLVFSSVFVFAQSQSIAPNTTNGQQPVRAAFRVSPLIRADQPSARTDENSRLAHLELLEKAKSGRIDVYFAGDSIIRRWGATDYPELLANWKQNFFGWNAADFGWGGDRTENILWRLNNGELDGVMPKVIVLLAGTNNVIDASTLKVDDAFAANVTQGIREIILLMQVKAPDSTIILTGIFTRNDDMALIPMIEKINRELSKLADGRKVRYLNINDKLADRDGRLFEGMMNAEDKLHPTIRGYQVWADALTPLLTEMLGAPRAEDHAPPPTGDPGARR